MFNVYTVKDVQYNEYVGFTDAKVSRMLEYYGFMDRYNAVKEWYDGYHFGTFRIIKKRCRVVSETLEIKA